MASAVTTKVYQSDSAYLVVRPRNEIKLTESEKAARSKFVGSQIKQDEIAQLRVEQKRIADQLREANATRKAERDAARANQPGKLEREVARQEKSRPWLGQVMASQVTARVKCGQSQDEAIDAVLAMVKERMGEALATMAVEAEAEALLPAQPVAPMAAIAPMAAQAAPKRNGKSASKASN